MEVNAAELLRQFGHQLEVSGSSIRNCGWGSPIILHHRNFLGGHNLEWLPFPGRHETQLSLVGPDQKPARGQ